MPKKDRKEALRRLAEQSALEYAEGGPLSEIELADHVE